MYQVLLKVTNWFCRSFHYTWTVKNAEDLKQLLIYVSTNFNCDIVSVKVIK